MIRGVMAGGGVCPWLQGEETPPPVSVGGVAGEEVG